MKLLVVIVCYKIPDLTIDCLASLDGKIQQVPGTHVAVVENGTGGDSASRIRAAIDGHGWGSWCTLTAIHPNLGFTGGNNVALREHLSSGDPPEYVLLLNADTIALDQTIAPLVDFMDRNPEVGIAGAQCLTPIEPHVPSMSYGRFESIATELNRGMRLGLVTRLLSPWVAMPALTTPQAVDWVPGACMILRRSLLDQIGLLDEGLYTYFDDLDICLHARRAGWETWFVPESRVLHIEGASTGLTAKKVTPKRRASYWFEARRRFFLKNHGPWYTALADAAFLFGYGTYRIRRLLQGKPDLDPPHFLGDSFRQSVFVQGFQVCEVRNPALADASSTAAPASSTAATRR